MSKELLFDTGALIDIYKGRPCIKPYFDAYIKMDAWIAAAAILNTAALVHKDAELAGLPCPQSVLPYK